MRPHIPPARPGFYGPPYFEVHAEGWALILIAVWIVGGILYGVLA